MDSHFRGNDENGPVTFYEFVNNHGVRITTREEKKFYVDKRIYIMNELEPDHTMGEKKGSLLRLDCGGGRNFSWLPSPGGSFYSFGVFLYPLCRSSDGRGVSYQAFFSLPGSPMLPQYLLSAVSPTASDINGFPLSRRDLWDWDLCWAPRVQTVWQMYFLLAFCKALGPALLYLFRYH